VGQLDAGCYIRVSTEDQSVENQRLDVQRLCDFRGLRPVWFEDQAISGTTTARPGYQALMRAARLGHVKTVVVWKLDRLGRTATQLILDVDALAKWGCAFISINDPVFDTTTPMGRFLIQLMAALAELERNMTVARTVAASKSKRTRAGNLGQNAKWGRGSMATPAQLRRLQELANQIPRPSLRLMAEALGLPKSTVHDLLQRRDLADLAGVPGA
jgi:DNA invertase Pin-like site-specific DNA recombinase